MNDQEIRELLVSLSKHPIVVEALYSKEKSEQPYAIEARASVDNTRWRTSVELAENATRADIQAAATKAALWVEQALHRNDTMLHMHDKEVRYALGVAANHLDRAGRALLSIYGPLRERFTAEARRSVEDQRELILLAQGRLLRMLAEHIAQSQQPQSDAGWRTGP